MNHALASRATFRRAGVYSSSTYRGLGIGSYYSMALAQNSIVIGNHIRAQGLGGIAIGEGVLSNGSFLTNDLNHSLAIGFNSNIPTFVVAQASGYGTTGNVGIGTSRSAECCARGMRVAHSAATVIAMPRHVNSHRSRLTGRISSALLKIRENSFH